MLPHDFVGRALDQRHQSTVYRLGGGKQVPYGDNCRDERGSCDCSAFVCWCAGFRKYQDRELWWLHKLNGGWLNTDGIWYSSLQDGGHFEFMEEASVGCVIVYPASWVSGIEPPKIKVGHVGIVTAVKEGKPTKVIHCSSGNYRKHGDAILETNADVFLKREATRYVWPSSVIP